LGHKIVISGYPIKGGKLVRDVRRLDVSARLRQRASKRVRVLAPAKATVRCKPEREVGADR
jgi:hypothetical protein